MKFGKGSFDVFEIVGDGMMSNIGIAEGRLIPAIIIDALDNKDIPDLIKMHKGIQSGDVRTVFGRKYFDKNSYFLTLNFKNPISISFNIHFFLPTHYSLIDGILQSKGLYLLTGKKGDNVSENIGDSILLEIPNGGFEDSWDNILRTILIKTLKNTSLSKKEKKELVKANIIEMREVWSYRHLVK